MKKECERGTFRPQMPQQQLPPPPQQQPPPPNMQVCDFATSAAPKFNDTSLFKVGVSK